MEGSGIPAGMGGEGAGQPGPSEGGGLDPGLFPGIDQVPAEYRQHLDPILREVNTNANKRISEVNEKLNTWKPYEELGVHEKLDPESMESVLGLLDIIAQAEEGQTDGFKQWWEAVGNEYGLMPQGEGGEFEFEGEGEGDGSLTPEELKALMQEQMQELVSPILQQQEQLEQEKLMTTANEKLDAEIAAVKQEFGDFDEETERKICQLALSYDGDGAFKKGFEDYKSIVEGAKGELFAKAQEQGESPTPQGPGTPNTQPKAVTDFKSATEAARAKLEASLNS